MVAAFKIQWDETEDRLLSLVNAPKHRPSPWKLSSEYLEISIITKLYQTLSTGAKALVCTCAPLKPSQHRLTGSDVLRHHDRVSSPPECVQTGKFVSFVRSCWRSAPPCTGIMHKYVCLCCQMWNVELVNNCRQVECCVGRLCLVSVRKWRSKCRVWKQRWKENKNTVGEWIKLSCLNVCMSHHVNIA